MRINKLVNDVVNGYDSFLEQGLSPAGAVILTAIFSLMGVVVGLGIDLVCAYGIMFVYNNLAHFYHWPVFSVWFWFIGLFVLASIGRIMFPNNR